MKKNYFPLILLISVNSFFSCVRQDESVSNSKIETKVVLQDTLNEVKEFKGLYFSSQQGSGGMLKICSGDTNSISYAVTDETMTLDSIYKKIIPDSYPFQTIFINVQAALKSGGTQNSPQTIVVKKVLKAEQKYFQNTCIPYDYWCNGNEPFWQVQISEKENLIDFYDPMIPKFYHFEYVKSENKNKELIYSTKNKTDKIRIVITKQKCRDGMSEREYNYKSEVLLNNKKYTGCATTFGEVVQ